MGLLRGIQQNCSRSALTVDVAKPIAVPAPHHEADVAGVMRISTPMKATGVIHLEEPADTDRSFTTPDSCASLDNTSMLTVERSGCRSQPAAVDRGTPRLVARVTSPVLRTRLRSLWS